MIQFDDREEFLKISRIIDHFVSNGISSEAPYLVIIMGDIGAGKTTLRRQKYSQGYVNFEFGEICKAVKKEFPEDHPKLFDYSLFTNFMILQESIKSKRNIVVEILGDNKDLIDPVIKKMLEVGYKLSLVCVECDLKKAYERHLKAVKEDKGYASVFFTQEATLSVFYEILGLGDMPATQEA